MVAAGGAGYGPTASVGCGNSGGIAGVPSVGISVAGGAVVGAAVPGSGVAGGAGAGGSLAGGGSVAVGAPVGWGAAVGSSGGVPVGVGASVGVGAALAVAVGDASSSARLIPAPLNRAALGVTPPPHGPIWTGALFVTGGEATPLTVTV